MTNQLFAAALGIAAPWFVQTVDFDAGQRRLTIHVDFVPGSRFAHAKAAGEHKVHDTQVKRLRHLNFFQHECYLEVRVPRVTLRRRPASSRRTRRGSVLALVKRAVRAT